MYTSFLFQGELNVSIARGGGTPIRSAPHPIYRRVLLIGVAAVAAVVAKGRTGMATTAATAAPQIADTMLLYNFFFVLNFCYLQFLFVTLNLCFN